MARNLSLNLHLPESVLSKWLRCPGHQIFRLTVLSFLSIAGFGSSASTCFKGVGSFSTCFNLFLRLAPKRDDWTRKAGGSYLWIRGMRQNETARRAGKKCQARVLVDFLPFADGRTHFGAVQALPPPPYVSKLQRLLEPSAPVFKSKSFKSKVDPNHPGETWTLPDSLNNWNGW